MEAPSSRQSRMAIDSILNPSRSSSDSVSCTPPVSPAYYNYSSEGYYPSHRHSHHHQRQYPYQHPYPESTKASFSFSQIPINSTESSPSPYCRDRYDSVSSSSSLTAPTTSSVASRASTSSTATTASTGLEMGDRRRPPRPKYEEEEMYFIWYHRVDLCQEWKEVRECFNRQFPNRQRSGFQGIQCKFYRFIRDKKCPTLREQRRMRDGEFLQGPSSPQHSSSGSEGMGPPKFGVVEWVGVWYPWMRENQEQVRMRKISR